MLTCCYCSWDWVYWAQRGWGHRNSSWAATSNHSPAGAADAYVGALRVLSASTSAESCSHQGHPHRRPIFRRQTATADQMPDCHRPHRRRRPGCAATHTSTPRHCSDWSSCCSFPVVCCCSAASCQNSCLHHHHYHHLRQWHHRRPQSRRWYLRILLVLHCCSGDRWAFAGRRHCARKRTAGTGACCWGDGGGGESAGAGDGAGGQLAAGQQCCHFRWLSRRYCLDWSCHCQRCHCVQCQCRVWRMPLHWPRRRRRCCCWLSERAP